MGSITKSEEFVILHYKELLALFEVCLAERKVLLDVVSEYVAEQGEDASYALHVVGKFVRRAAEKLPSRLEREQFIAKYQWMHGGYRGELKLPTPTPPPAPVKKEPYADKEKEEQASWFRLQKQRKRREQERRKAWERTLQERYEQEHALENRLRSEDAKAAKLSKAKAVPLEQWLDEHWDNLWKLRSVPDGELWYIAQHHTFRESTHKCWVAIGKRTRQILGLD